jgi:hypothetical protein
LTITATSERLDSLDAADLLPGYYIDRWRGTGAYCSLPWPDTQRGIDELLERSLGPQCIDWAEWRSYDDTGEPGLVHHLTGERWKFTPGQKRFLILWYAFDPASGRLDWRRGVKRGAKGTGKDPFGGALCDIELVGPSQLEISSETRSGWIGVQHRMPLVQIGANSSDQAKDVLRVANGMFGREARDFYQIDCGETRTILKGTGGGRLEVLTASEASSEGDPATFIWLNETHHMTESNGGHRVAKVARRNVGKSPMHLQARVCDGTNAHAQGSDSIAERSYEAWQAQVSGRTKLRDILYDSIEAPPSTDIYDDDSRMAGLRAAYMDAEWADLERLSGEMLDPETSVADAIRYYLSGLATAEDAWIDPRKFDDLARPFVIADREPIAMFLDCSKSEDSTGLMGCRISDGHRFVLGFWQRPHGDRGKTWLAPREEVDATVYAAAQRYTLVWFGVDPSPARDDDDESLYWMPLIDKWHRDPKITKNLAVWATPGQRGHKILFDMRIKTPGAVDRLRQFTLAAMQCAEDIDENGTLTHDGDAALRMHTHNARRRPNQWGVSLGKINRASRKLVDLAVCMVGAGMGRRIALNSGKLKKPKTGRTMFAG